MTPSELPKKVEVIDVLKSIARNLLSSMLGIMTYLLFASQQYIPSLVCFISFIVMSWINISIENGVKFK